MPTKPRTEQPRFEDYPADKQAIFTCSVCGQPCTFLTRLHARAHACTGCMLRTLRPYDYTMRVVGGVGIHNQGGTMTLPIPPKVYEATVVVQVEAEDERVAVDRIEKLLGDAYVSSSSVHLLPSTYGGDPGQE